MTPSEQDDVVLPAEADTSHEAFNDHPDDPLTEAEAEEGLAVYKAVDDTDDESNGLDQ